MHRYSSHCPCGVYHPHTAHCTYSYSYSDATLVDCTLSLGTPSTRRTSAADTHRSSGAGGGGNRLSNFCWDFLHQTTNNKHSSTKPNPSSSNRSAAVAPATAAADPIVSRRCANCDTSSTPLWRNGPRGPKSLCNACGIRYKKEERRASAAASTAHGAPMMESHVTNNGYNYWGSSHHHGQKELRFVDDDSESGSMQLLSWRLNVTDRPTSQLVYDFTR